jgi:cytidine deaminase
MNKKTRYYFDLATKIADAKNDKRSFKIGVVARRNDGVIVGAANGPTPYPERKAHGEARIVRKLDYNADLWIVRVLRMDGSLAMSRPCADCRKMLQSKKVSRVYYSISSTEMGIWHPATDTDSYHWL